MRPSARSGRAGDCRRRLAGPGDRRTVRRSGPVARRLPSSGLAGRAVRENDPDLRPSGSESRPHRPGQSRRVVSPLPLAPRPATAYSKRLPEPTQTLGRQGPVRWINLGGLRSVRRGGSRVLSTIAVDKMGLIRRGYPLNRGVARGHRVAQKMSKALPPSRSAVL